MTQQNPEAPMRENGTAGAQSGSKEGTLLKVAAKSRPSAIAGAIAGVIRGGNVAMVQAVGAASVNQAVKAIAIAQSYLQGDGISIVCIPSFLEVSIEDQERTAMCLHVEPR